MTALLTDPDLIAACEHALAIAAARLADPEVAAAVADRRARRRAALRKHDAKRNAEPARRAAIKVRPRRIEHG